MQHETGTQTGYQSTQEHLLDELDRVEAMLDAYERAQESETAGSQHAETPETTTSRDGSVALPPKDREAIAQETASIERRCRETQDVTLRLRVLADAFDLSRRALDVLLLALAPRLDDQFLQRFRAIQGDTRLSMLTVDLVEKLYSQTSEGRLAVGELLGSDAPLREHDLLVVQPPPDGMTTRRGRRFTVDDRIAEYLRGYDGVDTTLQADLRQHGTPGIEVCEADRSIESLVIDDGLMTRLEAAADAIAGSYRAYWYGPAESQRARAVEAVVGEQQYVRIDLDAVLDADALTRVRREVALLDLPVHLRRASTALERNSVQSLESVYDSFAAVEVPLVVTGSDEWTPTETMQHEIDAIVEFPYPDVELRNAFWDAHSDELPTDLDPAVLAGTFRLTPGQLRAAVSTARSLAGDSELQPEHVYEGCRAQSADELDSLAQHIEPSSDWTDIELPAETMDRLEIVRDHIRHQSRIYGQWGFEEQFSKGTGVVALFEGPSGTGKTMAAEILATDVGMDLYRIDLSSVVSKYIGETEENLEAIFQAAENSNSILLFDEADAVFGDRSEVSDSTDRYANAEVNYLLQRIESYDGVVLMTTNYASNIDSAFTRRIDHTVAFERPEQSIRDGIWQDIFPGATPLGEIDYDFLSTFEFTGGQIKTIGQTAAILAAGDDAGEGIEMRHLVRAIELAYQKEGKLLNPSEFEPYRAALSDVTKGETTSQQSDSEHERGPAGESPESVVRSFLDALDAGDGEQAHAYYHEGALADQFSTKELLQFEHGDCSIIGEIERIQERDDRVVLHVEWERDSECVSMGYDCRLDGEVWRLFDFGPASELGITV